MTPKGVITPMGAITRIITVSDYTILGTPVLDLSRSFLGAVCLMTCQNNTASASYAVCLILSILLITHVPCKVTENISYRHF